MLKKIAIVLVVIFALIMALAATRPDTFSVERRVTIKAPPEKIMPLLADFRNWQRWSPWERLDPNMQRTFSGPASGLGAAYAWTGNSDVGQGRMEIIEYTPPAKTAIKLQFIKPMAITNTTTFALSPQGDSTEVVWTMAGPMPFLSKVMSVFMSMDTMVGRDFERGLAQLKAAAEK